MRALVLTVVTVGALVGVVLAPVVGSADPAPCDSAAPVANLFIGGSAQATGGTVRKVITVTNTGPCSASGVVVTDQLPSALTFVSAKNITGSWTFTHNDVADVLTATLGNKLSHASGGNDGVASFEVTLAGAGDFQNTARVTNANESDQNPSDNAIVFGISRQITAAAPVEFVVQSASVARPQAASIALYQVDSNAASKSPVGAPVEAPCDDAGTCGTRLEVAITTPSTDCSRFPRERITVTITVYRPDLQNTAGIVVQRFVDALGAWATLDKCGGFKGDPAIGCVARLSLDRQTSILTIEVWTCRNGHMR